MRTDDAYQPGVLSQGAARTRAKSCTVIRAIMVPMAPAAPSEWCPESLVRCGGALCAKRSHCTRTQGVPGRSRLHLKQPRDVLAAGSERCSAERNNSKRVIFCR